MKKLMTKLQRLDKKTPENLTSFFVIKIGFGLNCSLVCPFNGSISILMSAIV